MISHTDAVSKNGLRFRVSGPFGGGAANRFWEIYTTDAETGSAVTPGHRSRFLTTDGRLLTSRELINAGGRLSEFSWFGRDAAVSAACCYPDKPYAQPPEDW